MAPSITFRGGIARMLALAALAGALASAFGPTVALAQQVRISGLTDIDFGDVGSAVADVSDAQNLCVYAGGGGYTVTASGSGSSNAFALRNGGRSLPYQVEWGFSSGQTAGLRLSPRVAVAGQASAFANLFCYFGSGSSASLIVTLKPADINAASAGNYSGTLTLLIAPD